jgi:hypothetical protein
MKKVYFLGDSVFDNKPYVNYGESVIEVYRRNVNFIEGELLAVDGDVIRNVYDQLRKIDNKPEDCILYISIGGNNLLGELENLVSALNNLDLLMNRFAEAFYRFDKEYGDLIEHISNNLKFKNVTLCTIYNPQFDDPIRGKFNNIFKNILIAFNESIKKHAYKVGFKIMDLNKMFDDKKYYANPIEPSFEGSKLIIDKVKKDLNSSTIA